MPLITNPFLVFAVLAINVSICEWLGRKKYFNHLGTALLVIILTAVFANIKLIPSAGGSSAYNGIFTYVAPLAIFYLLLNVNLASVRKAGVPMIVMFIIGSLGMEANDWVWKQM